MISINNPILLRFLIYYYYSQEYNIKKNRSIRWDGIMPRTPHLHHEIHVRNPYKNIPLLWNTFIKYMTKLQLLHLPHRKVQAWGIIVCLVFYGKMYLECFM